MKTLQKKLRWKIHVARLLEEITKGSGQPIYRIPLKMLDLGLRAIGARAAELNDPKLNAIMCQLTLYTIADPDSPDYDPQKTEEIINAGYGE